MSHTHQISAVASSSIPEGGRNLNINATKCPMSVQSVPPTSTGAVTQQAFIVYPESARSFAGDSHIKTQSLPSRSLYLVRDKSNKANSSLMIIVIVRRLYSYWGTKECAIHFAWGVGGDQGRLHRGSDIWAELDLQELAGVFQGEESWGNNILRQAGRKVLMDSWESELFDVLQTMRRGGCRSWRSWRKGYNQNR